MRAKRLRTRAVLVAAPTTPTSKIAETAVSKPSCEVMLRGEMRAEADAARMLALLSGRTHHVLTAIALRWDKRMLLAVSSSTVSLRALAAPEIERYVATGEPFDKAGGYAVQGRAAAFIARIEGSYSGIMGLPLHETAEALARIGFPVL